MKNILSTLVFICSLFTSVAQDKQVILVIDPGHGGSDPGHLSHDTTSLQEKELNLLIAKYFGGYIEKYLQNVKVIYTRTDDSFPSLDDRVELANSKKADYFISIHCNGYENKAINGTESHVHSMDLKKSVDLAKRIEHQFVTRGGRHSRGVKDQNDLGHSLQVLKYTNMTSVLVECGYITNHSEASFLNTTYGQEVIASAIYRAFRSQIQSDYPSTEFVKSTPTLTNSESQQYYVQIMSSKTEVSVDNSYFKDYRNKVICKKLNTSSDYKYVYLVGGYASKEEANNALPEIRNGGFSDAYVVYR